MGTARRTSPRFIDLTRLEPELVLAALREPGVLVNSASRLSSPRRWRSYPWRYDNLYLSIFWLDMAGKSLNLDNTVEWWDHIPHLIDPVRSRPC